MRYINIIDLKDFECYQNINCRLLYLELCSMMDYQTRDVVLSVRKLERSLPLTYAAIRHALAQLIKSGVIAQVSTQEGAQEGAQSTTQRTTHLHIVSFSELQGANSASSSAISNATSSATSSAISNAEFNKGNKNNINKNNQITHTRAEEILKNFESSKISMYVDISEHRVEFFTEEFLKLMGIKGRTWASESDLIGHFLDWAVKNKKQLLSRADSRAASEEEPQPNSAAEEPHPRDKTIAEWNWIKRMVASGKAAPLVVEEYHKGCYELGIIPTLAL